MKTQSKQCPECDGHSLYQASTCSGSPHGPRLLPGLGSFLSFAKMKVVVCADCGLTRFYASEDARSQLGGVRRWQRCQG